MTGNHFWICILCLMGENGTEGEVSEILAEKILSYITKPLVHMSPFRNFTSFPGGSPNFPKSLGHDPLSQIPHSFFPRISLIWEVKSLVVGNNFFRLFKGQESRPEYWFVFRLSHTSFFFLLSPSRGWVTWASRPNVLRVRQATNMRCITRK